MTLYMSGATFTASCDIGFFVSQQDLSIAPTSYQRTFWKIATATWESFSIWQLDLARQSWRPSYKSFNNLEIMVVCDNAGLVVSSVSHIIDTNNVAAKLLPGQEAAASWDWIRLVQFVKSIRASWNVKLMNVRISSDLFLYLTRHCCRVLYDNFLEPA